MYPQTNSWLYAEGRRFYYHVITVILDSCALRMLACWSKKCLSINCEWKHIIPWQSMLTAISLNGCTRIYLLMMLVYFAQLNMIFISKITMKTYNIIFLRKYIRRPYVTRHAVLYYHSRRHAGQPQQATIVGQVTTLRYPLLVLIICNANKRGHDQQTLVFILLCVQLFM